MKFLLDCLVTATPSKCSTTIQMYTFVNRMLEKYEEVWFYWMVPEYLSEEELAWFPQSDRVEYIKVPAHKDRMNEYLNVSQEAAELIQFYGTHWDWDVLITNRTGMVPRYKLLANSPRQPKPSKEVWVIENMPLMKFKGTIAVMDKDVQDLFTLAGYLAADRVMVMSYHEKTGIIRTAQEYFTPSHVMGLQKKLKNVVPSQITTMELKPKELFYKLGQETPFKVSFIGRMPKSGSNLDSVYRSMTNHWIFSGEANVELHVLTVTKNPKFPPPSYFTMRQLPREEFWEVVKTELHVGLVMYEEAGFLLGLMEPIFFGTPMIVLDRPYARGQLGDDYPFYVKGEAEAYAMLRSFYKDYAAQYARFEKYCREWLWPTYEKRFQDDLLYNVLEKYMLEFPERIAKVYDASPNRGENQTLKDIMDVGGDEFSIEDAILELGRQGRSDSLSRKITERFKNDTGLTWLSPLDDYRKMLCHFHGYKDASLKVGHIVKITEEGK